MKSTILAVNAPAEGEVAGRLARRHSSLAVDAAIGKAGVAEAAWGHQYPCQPSIAGFAKRRLDRNCTVVSNGLRCFSSLVDAGVHAPGRQTASRSKAYRTLVGHR